MRQLTGKPDIRYAVSNAVQNLSVQNLDSTAKGATIAAKGEQNEGRNAADSEDRGQERDGVVSEVSQEHERRVGIERQVISKDVNTPYRLREAYTKDGEGLIHYPEGYDSPEYKEAQAVASSYGLEVIPIKDTSNTINAFIQDGSIFVNMEITKALLSSDNT
ncbi:MAG: hypothetical protein V1685_02000 [Parcubacteria group bacterium]